MANDPSPSFLAVFNSRFSFGPTGQLTGRLGTGVLDGLIAGIDEFGAALL
jgi:hypothetical protein